MKINQKKLLMVLVVIFFQLGVVRVSDASFISLKKSNLSSILESGLFSAFSTETNYNRIDGLQMCNGSLLEDCRVSSEFGWRKHPRRRWMHYHTGIDLAAPKGTPIIAPADGVVMSSGRGRGYGRMVSLDHGYAWSSRYAHMRKIFVKKGDHVKKGDVIGLVGSSGVSTGPHLHFEILYFGSVVDPRSYFASLDKIKEPAVHFANR